MTRLSTRVRAAWRPSRRLAARPEPLPAAVVWALSGWIGLVCGLAESVVRLAWRLIEHRVSSPDLWVNWHSPWMAPIALAGLCAGLGMLASVAVVVLPRSVAWLLPRLLVGLGAWSALSPIAGLHPWAVLTLAAGLGVRLGGRARFERAEVRRFARRSLPAAAGAWLILALATGLLPATAELRGLAFGPKPKAGAKNVVLIVLDTVRADNLGLYGYGRPTSPHLDAWARRGVRFDRARATTPYTLGTHASLFTGCWMSQTSARVNTPLDGARTTLAEHLRDRGYATAGFVGNIFYGSAHYGLDRGFLRYLDVPGDITRRVTARELVRSCGLGAALLAFAERKWRILEPLQRQRLDAATLNREALAWVDRQWSTGRPFFLFLNAFDAHAPYTLPPEAPQPFARRSPEWLEARLKELERCETLLRERPSPALQTEVESLRAEVTSALRDLYDDGIAWIDRNLDALLRGLERRGLLDQTLVIITADHGELLGEHGLIGHGDSLHRQVVHVPLVILGARGMRVPAGIAVDRPASLRDIPATVVDLLGEPAPGPFPGRSLRRYWEGGDPGDDPVLSEMEHMSWLSPGCGKPAALGPLRLLTEGPWSYHRQRLGPSTVRESLFDLDRDPSESVDLAADPAHRATLERLRRRLDRELARASAE